MHPRQAAARPPLYLLSSPPRRQPEAPAPVETGKTGATQLISKAVRGLPIAERRSSIIRGLHRVPCPFAIVSPNLEAQRQTRSCANRGKKHVLWDNCGRIADFQFETRRSRRPRPFTPHHGEWVVGVNLIAQYACPLVV